MTSTSAAIQPLESQVGGHPGVLTTENGLLLIKPAVPTEVAFYERLKQDSNLEGLRVFTPTFLGTLELMGKIDETSSTVSEAIVSAEEKEFIVLENLSFPFLKPNILDVKLGTVLHDKNAPPEKAARKQKYARDTTSFETGIRLTAFQVYDNITCQPVHTPKSYGRSLKAAQLSEGIAKFFPCCSPTSQTSDTPSSSSGLPKETLEPILRAIYEEVAEMREVYSSLEIRAVGASLLIIYEADWTRAEQSLRSFGEDKEEDDEEDVDDDDDDEDECNSKRPGPPFVAKLIDFAHTYLAPNEGP